MKLCRFELKAEPGRARSGMVYSGKIYETDGATAVAVHEADAVIPLAPIPHSPSVRIFRSDLQGSPVVGLDLEEPHFFYANPTTLFGASQVLNYPAAFGEIGAAAFLAAVVVSDGYQVPIEDADDVILGYMLALFLTSESGFRHERGLGAVGRSHDLGAVIGPVITTPDELDEEVVDLENGRKHSLEAVLRVNGVERGRANTQDLPITFAQAIVSASHSSPIRSGDIFAIGPLAPATDPLLLDPGDEVQVAVQKLGTLSLKLSRNL